MMKIGVLSVVLILLMGSVAGSLEDLFGPEAEAQYPYMEDSMEESFLEAESELGPYMEAELEHESEADVAQFAAFLEAEHEARALMSAEGESAEAVAAATLAEAEAVADAEAEDSLEEEDTPATATAAAPAAGAAPAAPGAPGATAPTPIPANATAPTNGTANATKPLVPVDEEDAANIAAMLAHDGRQGSVKPIVPIRKNETGATAELSAIESEKVKIAKQWAQRAEDEQRTNDATAELALKLMGKLPPVEKHVIAATGAMDPDSVFVPAGTDQQEVGKTGAKCASGVVKAATA